MDRFVVDVLLLREGKPVMNAETALLLKYIDETGSILSAAKKLGLSYSRAWSYVAKAERALGVKLVEARKGYGGGAELTREGRTLLSRYLEFVERRLGGLEELAGGLCDFVYAGSSDPFMEYLLDRLKEEGFCVEARWVGSTAGLMMVASGLADVAGTHLFDPLTEDYNVPYIERLGLSTSLVLHKGYMRSIGFVYGRDVGFSGLEDLLRFRIVNRNAGSGTRALLEHLLDKLAFKLGASKRVVAQRLEGYLTEVSTHQEAARRVAEGEADIGLAVAAAAEAYGLQFRQVALERFDVAVSRKSLNKPAVRRLLELIRREEMPSGYVAVKGSGLPIVH